MNDLHDLTLILQSRFPLVVVETHEEPRVVALLEQAANLEGLALFIWSVADGLRRSNNSQPITQTYQFLDALRHVDKTQQNGVYVMLDAHPYLSDPVNARLVREIANEYNKTARTLVFVSPRLELNAELARMSARFALSVPGLETIQGLLREEMQLWARQGNGEPVRGEKEALNLLARHLTGMALDDARRLARQAIRNDGLITHKDIDHVLRFKYDALGAGSVLSLELDTASFAQVGGVKKLKRWLELRRDVFVGDRSQIQVRMRTVVGGHYTAIVSLGDTALGTEPIPADRVTLPYNLVRTVTDATRLTDQVAAGSVHDTLDRVADGLRGDNAHTFATVLDAGNALTAAIDRQRGQLSTILHVSDEYLDALRGHTAELRAMLQKVSIIEATLVVYAEGFGRALAGMGDVLDGLNPVGQFYAGNSASFIEKVRNWQEIVATWAERSGLVVRGLRRVRDKLDRVLDAQNARPVLLATDLCIPLPDRAC